MIDFSVMIYRLSLCLVKFDLKGEDYCERKCVTRNDDGRQVFQKAHLGR